MPLAHIGSSVLQLNWLVGRGKRRSGEAHNPCTHGPAVLCVEMAVLGTSNLLCKINGWRTKDYLIALLLFIPYECDHDTLYLFFLSYLRAGSQLITHQAYSLQSEGRYALCSVSLARCKVVLRNKTHINSFVSIKPGGGCDRECGIKGMQPVPGFGLTNIF